MSDSDNPADLDVQQALRNIVALLQQDPRRYKLFGVWWWPIKAVLRGAGYRRDQLPMLGDYEDPETAAAVPRAGLTDTLLAALQEYGCNARFPRPDGGAETPDGEVVKIYDPDAGI